jgi:hypothetical protein
MQRDPLIASPIVLRLLTLAITLVVGFQVGPRPCARHGSTPVVSSADQKVCADISKTGQRLEPGVFPSRFGDRLPPLRPSCVVARVCGADQVVALGASVFDGRADAERLPIVKHVPRMERGDPPRT